MKKILRTALPMAVVATGAVVATLALAPAQAAPHVVTRTVTDTAKVDALSAKVDRLTAKLDKARGQRDNLRDQRDEARDQRDTATATLDGQYDVNADYADQIASLTDQLADARQSASVSDDPLAPAHGDADRATWEGFTVGQVIVCPDGWTVSIDDADHGQQWAACM